jgi:hypothetical protein
VRWAGARWVGLKKLYYVDAKGCAREWEMAERILQRTDGDGPAPANGVGIVAIISTVEDKDNDQIILGTTCRAWWELFWESKGRSLRSPLAIGGLDALGDTPPGSIPVPATNQQGGAGAAGGPCRRRRGGWMGA